jgi:ribosomal protein S18 acetylase RimI-like enzyme
VISNGDFHKDCLKHTDENSVEIQGSLQGEEERTRGQVVGTVELSFASSTRTRGLTLNPPAVSFQGFSTYHILLSTKINRFVFGKSTSARALTLPTPPPGGEPNCLRKFECMQDGAYLCNMAVGVKFQRRGYARAMLAAAEDVVQLAGFRRVWLHVRLVLRLLLKSRKCA